MAPTEELALKTFEDLPEDVQRRVFGALMEMREHFSMEEIEALMPELLWDVECSRQANEVNRMNMEMCQHSRQGLCMGITSTDRDLIAYAIGSQRLIDDQQPFHGGLGAMM